MLFPLWISDIVGAADLLLAMVLGSVLLLGRRSGGGSVLSTRHQRPTRGGRDDGKRPGRAGADDPFQPGESIDLLTLRLISVDLAANAPRERRKGYSVRSDEGDEARCGRCCMTTVRR